MPLPSAAAVPDVLDAHLMLALEDGAVIVTANQRLARHLQQRYVASRLAHGLTAWRTPEILSLSAWLERAWAECIDHAAPSPSLVLSPHHAQLLWEGIISRSRHGRAMLDVAATAEHAQEAWSLCRQYCLGVPRASSASEDARAFSEWAARFEQLCRESHWVDAASLADEIALRTRERVFAVPARMILIGFHELTPQQQALFDTVRAAGAQVAISEVAPIPAQLRRVTPGDIDSEIRAAAQWARRLLESGANDIGVIVRDLGRVRDRVERIFADVIAPGGGDARGAFNISLGRPLARYPIVQGALFLLELGRGRIALDRLGVLLRSPFLAGAERESIARAHLDARLRESGQLEFTFDGVRAYLQTSRAGQACPALAARLKQAESFGERRRRPSEWAEAFGAWLSVLGWPGERALDSDEYQTAMAWRDLLAQYRSLDAVAGRQSAGEALSVLRRMAARSVFQSQQEAAPIQILGVLEASGLRFEHAWLLGFADDAWPPSPRPHPFLPLALQRAHDLPHASAARELAFCRRITAELRACAPDVVVSSPASEGERHLLVTPLLQDIPEADLAALVTDAQADYAAQMQASGALETLVDEYGPPFTDDAAVGGSALFRNQAACPFRAYAHARLYATGIAPVQIGLDAAERGTLLHQVLFDLWGRLRDQQGLLALREDEVETRVRESVEVVLGAATARASLRFPPVFVRLEGERLFALVCAWLERERGRAPFSVAEREQARTVAIEGLQVKTRADRIDRLADGSYLIIDYKTGCPSEAGWFGERPDEPQLPLYCVTSDLSIAGVAFAQLVQRDLRWRGIAREDGIADGIAAFDGHRAVNGADSWEAIVAHWRDSLARLAREFRAGYARVDPKDGVQTCRYCDLAALCRIHEHDGLGLAEDDDD